jgi:hypothetical protein
MRLFFKFIAMRKLLIILILLFLFSPGTDAQLWKLNRYEVSGGIGTTQLFGDIGGYSNDKNILGLRDLTLRNTGFNLNSGVKYRITEGISVRIGIASGLFHSSDIGGSYSARAFEEKTIFFEPSLTGQYCFIKNHKENSRLFIKGEKRFFQKILYSFDLYTFTGFGGLMYKIIPNGELSENTTATNGFTAVLPLGIGFSFVYSSKINFSAEYGARFTFSDNIDGFSSVHSTANDIYHIVNFIVSYKINTGKMGGGIMERRHAVQGTQCEADKTVLCWPWCILNLQSANRRPGI